MVQFAVAPLLVGETNYKRRHEPSSMAPQLESQCQPRTELIRIQYHANLLLSITLPLRSAERCWTVQDEEYRNRADELLTRNANEILKMLVLFMEGSGKQL